MAQETQEIDIRMWCIRILKNWYWILLSCIQAPEAFLRCRRYPKGLWCQRPGRKAASYHG